MKIAKKNLHSHDRFMTLFNKTLDSDGEITDEDLK